ncbi:MAG: ATP-binding cassette domain-containing protein [Rhodospirillaceae bacterium]|jgi:phospholipid/cholesterol/gamma-HCH transport system ATP-binding protein|nr:ATP-binding cassette domain-containing protein [Rhodospirillaceae bacterium]MBT5455441.1 ATP-binding cassette domain-containing protein [Rhodospirillaceae bacterium]
MAVAALDRSETEEPVIRISGLQTYYGARQVLFDIDLTIEPGEIMVIMGGSGSGKSTLLRHLVGLDRPNAGSIDLLGLDITRASSMEMMQMRRKIGVAFQGGALFSSMTVLENLMLPLREHTKLDAKTMEIMARLKLEVVGLAGFGDLMPSELSGGMLKRAAVARAIVMDPDLLFFDEPSAGLDPVVSSALDDLILLLRDALNMTIVVVTHELESAFKIADRVTILDQGKILIVDTVEGIRRSDNERIQNLLSRRAEDTVVDAESYLKRLTGEV